MIFWFQAISTEDIKDPQHIPTIVILTYADNCGILFWKKVGKFLLNSSKMNIPPFCVKHFRIWSNRTKNCEGRVEKMPFTLKESSRQNDKVLYRKLKKKDYIWFLFLFSLFCEFICLLRKNDGLHWNWMCLFFVYRYSVGVWKHFLLRFCFILVFYTENRVLKMMCIF